METKKCTGQCGLEKTLDYFSIRKDTGKLNRQCRTCMVESKKRWLKENPDYNKKWAIENSKKIKENHKRWVKKNPNKEKENHKRWEEENPGRAVENSKKWKKENPERVKETRKKRAKERNKEDLAYKLRKYASKNIWEVLRFNGSSKAGHSILEFLPYTSSELAAHIESLFEPWMTRKNQGVYDPKIWNDNNPDTWKWQLDHIVPQSDLPYISMKDENFKKCWDLSNLRPLSAKQNWLDGVNRTRHNKEDK